MGIGPKKMGEAVAKNLKIKTGKSLEEWVALLKATKIITKREAVDFLKNEKGLGQFQAIKVFQSSQGMDDYRQSDLLINSLFSNDTLANLYAYVQEVVKKNGSDIEIQPCKTYIPFYRKHQFAILFPIGEAAIGIGLKTPDLNRFPEFSSPCKKGSAKINGMTMIASKKALTNNIKEAIRQAYLAN